MMVRHYIVPDIGSFDSHHRYSDKLFDQSISWLLESDSVGLKRL